MCIDEFSGRLYPGVMPRGPGLTLGQWLRGTGIIPRPWVRDASCGEHQHLPWIDDHAPTYEEQAAMAAVCDECPVIKQCAEYGLTTPGGFYAGVWIPWKPVNGSERTRHYRTQGRNRLRSILRRETHREIVAAIR